MASGQFGTQGDREATPVPGQPLEDILRAHTDSFMAVPGVVGIAEGLCDSRPCIKVFVAKKTAAVLKAIPASVEGYPVVVEETGEFRPFAPPRR